MYIRVDIFKKKYINTQNDNMDKYNIVPNSVKNSYNNIKY